MPDLQLLPPSLTASAGPLREAGLLLRALADDRRGLEHLGDGSPDPAVRTALRSFIETWELALWDLSARTLTLSDDLRRCAEDYALADSGLGRDVPGWLPVQAGQGVLR